MRVAGVVKPMHLDALKQRGFTPKAAVDAILDEARRRNPNEEAILIKSDNHDGFNIIAMPSAVF